MRKIILNNTAEYEVNRCGAADGVLWIGFPENVLTLAEAVSVFSDTNATKKIISTYDFPGMETTYEGYTSLIHLQIETEGTLLLALRRQPLAEEAD